MPHGNQSESECLLGGKIGKIGKIPGILRVYLKKPGYTRVIPALLHGFAPGTTPTAATTTENPAYHFRIPLSHTTPKLIKISPNTSLIPVKFEHWFVTCLSFIYLDREPTGRTEKHPPLCLTLAMASLGVSWAGRLRVRHSHGGLASGRASETRGCPLAGRDLHGNPLHTDLCFWRLLLALCAIATPEAVLGECVAVLLRQWIEPRRRLHR